MSKADNIETDYEWNLTEQDQENDQENVFTKGQGSF